MTTGGTTQERYSIAFILPSFAGGGAERVVLNLLALIEKRRFDPVLIVLNPHGPLSGEVPPGVRVVALNRRRLRDALPELVGTLRTMRPNVAFSTFTHVNFPLLALQSLFPATRLLVREANLPSINLARMPWPWGFRKGYRWLYPNAYAVVATSAIMAGELEEFGVPSCKISLLNNPVDDVALRSKAEPVERWPGAGLRFVAVGRLHPQKGFDRLLNYMAQMPPDSHCTILGEGAERPALEQMILSLGLNERVVLPGYVSNPASMVAAADALVMPSRFEGMPNAALEALALGTPVIATSEAGGIGEVAGVTIAEAGTAFLDAMCRVVHKPTGLSPSLLPERFRPASVAKELNALAFAAARSSG
jgi:glycosyltransferase involved in cell wall biosynthesis